MQKIDNHLSTCLQKNRAEPEGYVGGQTFIGMIEKNLTKTNSKVDELLEQLLDRHNLNAVYLQVVGKRGAGGIGKMGVESLGYYLREHKEELLVSIKQGEYSPSAVRRVEIPKDNGSKRMLGIPTVVDRLIQQGISQILTPIYEPEFSDHSYGVRPRRNAHQGLIKCREYIQKGYKYAVVMDLEKFFDTVNHSKLIELLSHKINDGRLISLVHKYLRAGVEINGRITVTTEGVVQLGVNKYKAHEWANTRKSYWHPANSWILGTTHSNDYLKQLGYPTLLAEYKRVRATT